MFKKIPFKLVLLFIFLILIGGGFYAWRHHQAQSSLNIIHPQFRDVVKTLELSGKVTAEKIANLHFATSGKVVYYPFHEGDEIRRYQTIASLDQRQLQKQLRRSLNLYAKTRNSFDQTYDNYKDRLDLGDIDSQLKRILEDAQYDLNNSVIDVELQALSLEYSRLIAPFSGILVRSPITTPNVNITPADTFTLVDPQSLYFSADVEESDLAYLKKDLPATISLDMMPDESFPATLTSLSFAPKSNQTTTIYEAKFIFSEPPDNLRLDLSGTAKLVLNKRSHVLSLPVTALHQDDQGHYYVLVLQNGQSHHQPVTLGLMGDEYVEIKDGLSLQDKVIVEE